MNYSSMRSGDFYLSDKEKLNLLIASRATLEDHFGVSKSNKNKNTSRSKYDIAVKAGAFVTIYHSGELRGCIGRMESNEELGKLVKKMALSSATRDHRFESIKADELDGVEIEISVLTPKKRIHSIDDFDITRHGIYIQKGALSGTFLPQVATDTGWDKEELLGRCARDKVGIGWSDWKTADLFVYEVIHFSETDFKS